MLQSAPNKPCTNGTILHQISLPWYLPRIGSGSCTTIWSRHINPTSIKSVSFQSRDACCLAMGNDQSCKDHLCCQVKYTLSSVTFKCGSILRFWHQVMTTSSSLKVGNRQFTMKCFHTARGSRKWQYVQHLLGIRPRVGSPVQDAVQGSLYACFSWMHLKSWSGYLMEICWTIQVFSQQNGRCMQFFVTPDSSSRSTVIRAVLQLKTHGLSVFPWCHT